MSGQTDRGVSRRRFLGSASGALGAGIVLLAGCATQSGRGTPDETATLPTTGETNNKSTKGTAKYDCKCTDAHDYEWEDPDLPDELLDCPKCGESSTIVKNPIPGSDPPRAMYTHTLCPENPVEFTGSTENSKCPVDPSHGNVTCTLSE